MNEEIECLFPVEKDEIHKVNTDEYLKILNSLYKETTLENSIISHFYIDDDVCEHVVTLKDMTGKDIIKSKEKFSYDTDFIDNFFILMVEEYNKENVIFDSTIEVLDDTKAKFIARTKSNDSLVLEGISIELANYFKDIISRKEITISEELINEKGIGNYLVIILTIITIGISLIGTVIFSLIYYRS